MAKKSKKQNNRWRDWLGALLMIAPALLAALTAFLNTTSGKSRGLLPEYDGGSGAKGSGRKASRKGKSGS